VQNLSLPIRLIIPCFLELFLEFTREFFVAWPPSPPGFADRCHANSAGIGWRLCLFPLRQLATNSHVLQFVQNSSEIDRICACYSATIFGTEPRPLCVMRPVVFPMGLLPGIFPRIRISFCEPSEKDE
jgi:hypothetical protein